MVAVACILCASSAGASAAQHSKHGNDPARWYNGDSTQQQRMNVLKKELNAAYAEQTAACKKKSSGKRSACLKEARATYQHDSANARRLVANAPQSEITERVVSTTPASGQDTMRDGASAYGSSGSTGQTGAGSSQGMSGAQPSTGQQSDARRTGAEQSGAMGYGSSQSTGSSTPPVQSGTGATQSMGAGTGATQSDTQDQPRAGAVPPVQR
jgi:hypothetical protein